MDDTTVVLHLKAPNAPIFPQVLIVFYEHWQGRRVEEGSGAQVLGAPQHPYTQRLLASLPVPDSQEQARRREELRVLRQND